MRFQFLNFILDEERRELIQGDAPVRISPKNFEVLLYLVENRDRMVPKSELMTRFWAANTSEAALQKSISQLRRSFAVGGQTPEIIKTYHARGFRFVAGPEAREKTPEHAGIAEIRLGEQRFVTLLCALVPDDAADDHSAQTDVMEHARALIEQHGGRLLQSLINGFIASFGSAPVFEDSARLASHCALALGNVAGMSWRIGLDSGALAHEDRPRHESWALPGVLERDVAKLAERANPDEILLSGAVLDQIRDEAEIETAGPVHRLISVGTLRSGIPARPRKRISRYVGRAPDLNFLQTQLDLATSGQGQAVALSGPPGIGKSRMVQEFLARLDKDSHRCELVYCLPGLRNSPYASLGALCRNLSAAPSDNVLRDDVDAALWRLLIDRPERSDAARLADMSDRHRQQRTLSILLRVLDELFENAALVLVFEDIHWLDTASRSLVSLLLREAERRAWMILMTTRPQDTPPPTERTLQLAPLTKAESASLFEDAADGVDLSSKQLQALLDRADGNPFFIEELALTAVSGGDPVTHVPNTVQAVIAARIGNLDVAARQILYVIAVLGTPAEPGRVAALVRQTEHEVAATADMLIRMKFLIHDPRGYVFDHMLIEDTAYAMIDRKDRRALHAEIAALMEASEILERPERLAWHHQEAGNITRAIEFWTAASRGAIHRAAWAEAANFADSGLALVRSDSKDADSSQLNLLLCKAPSLIALKGFPAPEVGAAYARASQLNQRVGSPKTEIRVRVGQWINTWVRGELTASLGHADALVALSRQFPDPALVLQGHASRGQVLMHMGQLGQASDQLQLGLDAIQDEPPKTPQAQNAAVSCAAYASWVAGMMGHSDQALTLVERSLELSMLRDNPYAVAIHNALCLETFMFLGDVAMCLDYSNRAIDVSTDNDYTFWLGTGLVMRGWCLGQSNDFENALTTISEGITMFAGTGAGVQLANWHGLHSEVLLRSGDDVASMATAERALTCAKAVGDIYFCPRIHSTMEHALARLNRPKDAKAESQNAYALAAKFAMCSQAINLNIAR